MNVLRVAAFMLTLAGAGVAVTPAQEAPSRSVKDGVYATAQATQGQVLYDEKCAECHGTMESVFPDMAPLLHDYLFLSDWQGRSLGELFERIRDTMPQEEPGSLSPEELVDLVAYILSANRFPPGDAALAHDVETLRAIRFDTDQP